MDPTLAKIVAQREREQREAEAYSGTPRRVFTPGLDAEKLRAELKRKRLSERSLAELLKIPRGLLRGRLTGRSPSPHGWREEVEAVLGLEAGALR